MVRGEVEIKRMKGLSGCHESLQAPVREHSRKPDEFYEIVETLCPVSKVDLSAREGREGRVTRGGQKICRS
jgi:N6-adenosine-specific RNA methylase IME4